MNAKTKLVQNFNQSQLNRDLFLQKESNGVVFEQICYLITECFRTGGRLYIIGNGGSATDASHLAAEFVCKIGRKRPAMPAEALTTDLATLTAISNDFSYEDVFTRQLEAKMTKKDVLLAITTSGNSKNITKALQNFQEYTTILLSGKDGGQAKYYSQYSLIVPGNTASEIQELHQTIYHTLVEVVESNLFFDGE